MDKDISDRTKKVLPQFGVRVFNAQSQFPLTDAASMAGKPIGTHKKRSPVERSLNVECPLNMEVKEHKRSRDEYAPIWTELVSVSIFPSVDNTNHVAIKPEKAGSAKSSAESKGGVVGNTGGTRHSFLPLFNHNMNEMLKARALSAASSSTREIIKQHEGLGNLSTKIRRPT